MKEKILLSIAQFEDIYNEWEDYKIKIVKDDRVSVYDNNDDLAYNSVEAKELLTDFKSVLKKNNLMITSYGNRTAKIGLYIYSFETEYEELADQIERTLGNRISNLFVYRTSHGNPHVKFTYTSNITSGEKAQIRKLVETQVNEFQNKISQEEN